MFRLNLEPIEPLQLLQTVVDEELPVALRNRQYLNVELPFPLPTVWADGDCFCQVVTNLMNEAFKFTPSGGRIALKAKEEDANLVAEVHGGQIWVKSVKGKGCAFYFSVPLEASGQMKVEKR